VINWTNETKNIYLFIYLFVM